MAGTIFNRVPHRSVWGLFLEWLVLYSVEFLMVCLEAVEFLNGLYGNSRIVEFLNGISFINI